MGCATPRSMPNNKFCHNSPQQWALPHLAPRVGFATLRRAISFEAFAALLVFHLDHLVFGRPVIDEGLELSLEFRVARRESVHIDVRHLAVDGRRELFQVRDGHGDVDDPVLALRVKGRRHRRLWELLHHGRDDGPEVAQLLDAGLALDGHGMVAARRVAADHRRVRRRIADLHVGFPDECQLGVCGQSIRLAAERSKTRAVHERRIAPRHAQVGSGIELDLNGYRHAAGANGDNDDDDGDDLRLVMARIAVALAVIQC